MPSVETFICVLATLIVAVSATVPYLVEAGERWVRTRTGEGDRT
jgi:regulator of protease activity HflC (stomatin/prohibitin superfamily)